MIEQQLPPKQIKDQNRKAENRRIAEILREELKAGHRESVRPVSEPKPEVN